MSEGMIGRLPVDDVRGLVGDLLGKLASADGPAFATELAKFNNREPCWQLASVSAPRPLNNRWRRSLLRKWTRFYQKLGITTDLSGVQIPEQREGFDRLLVIPQELGAKPLTRIHGLAKSMFPSWRSHDDLDLAIPTNDRDPRNGSYAIWCRNRQEADEELQNLSAEDLATRGTQTMTVLELAIFELVWHDETGGHLDPKNVTLCAGSRSSGGNVPGVYWVGRKLHVSADWYFVSGRTPCLRAREVVSA